MLKYKAIIFDLGGVIVNLDQDRTIRSFKRLDADLDAINEKLPVFKQYETGKIDTDTFIQTLKAELKGKATDGDIVNAWNNMILNVTADRISILKHLRKSYKLFILSNTNELHIKEFKAIFEKDHPDESWESLFDKIYYSHQIGLRKPHAEAWQYILDDQQLKAAETIFIDDTRMHFKTAEDMGMKSILTNKPIGQWFVDEIKSFEVIDIQKGKL